MKKERGVTTIEALLMLSAMMLIMGITLPSIHRVTNNVREVSILTKYVTDVFIGMEIHYHDHVNRNGVCYNAIIPQMTATELRNIGFIESSTVEPTFFNSTTATLTYSASALNGRIDTLRIEVVLPNAKSPTYKKVPYWDSSTTNTLSFIKKMEFSTDPFVINNLNTTFCKEY